MGKVIILVLILVYLVYSLYGYIQQNFERVTSQYDVMMQENGKRIADYVNVHMKTALMSVEEMAASYYNCDDIHSKEAMDKLVLMSRQSNFSRMWLTKINGEAVSSENTKANALGRPYMQDIQNGKSGISNVQVSIVSGKKML